MFSFVFIIQMSYLLWLSTSADIPIEERLKAYGIYESDITEISIESRHYLRRRNVESVYNETDAEIGEIAFNVTVFNSLLSLDLTRDVGLFAKDAAIHVEKLGNQRQYMPSRLSAYFTGTVRGHPGSFVHGGFTDNMMNFDGIIRMAGNDNFYAEPLSRFIKDCRPHLLLVYKQSETPAITHQVNNLSLNDIPNSAEGELLDDERQRWKRNWFEDDFDGSSRPIFDNRTETSENKTKPRFCSLHLVIDEYFVYYMAGRSTSYALTLVQQYIQEASGVFELTDFDGDGNPEHISLLIKAVTFWDKLTNFDYSDPDKDAQIFLKTFTNAYRTGIGGEKNHAYITTVLYSQMLTKQAVVATVAHEIGHGFGSPHDPVERGTLCTPLDSEGGGHLMNPTIQSLQLPNHFQFSPCSRESIGKVVAAKGHTAFTIYQPTSCGNGAVESGEECDCGTASSCHRIDTCCIPAGYQGSQEECMLKKSERVECSEAMPCCQLCRVTPASEQTQCFSEQECKYAQVCNGQSAHCPPIQAKPDGTLCQDGLKICVDGECQQSICDAFNHSQCDCPEQGKECRVCCTPLNSTRCVFANSIPGMEAVPEWLTDGSFCSGDTGFCHENFCEIPGLLNNQRFVTIILNSGGWWQTNSIVIVIGIILILLVISAIKFFSRKKSSTNTSNAFSSGRTARAYYEGERMLRGLEYDAERLAAAYIHQERPKQDFVIAESRLQKLFPTISLRRINDTLTTHSNESGAVHCLLLQGHPMLSLIKSHAGQVNETKAKVHHRKKIKKKLDQKIKKQNPSTEPREASPGQAKQASKAANSKSDSDVSQSTQGSQDKQYSHSRSKSTSGLYVPAN